MKVEEYFKDIGCIGGGSYYIDARAKTPDAIFKYLDQEPIWINHGPIGGLVLVANHLRKVLYSYNIIYSSNRPYHCINIDEIRNPMAIDLLPEHINAGEIYRHGAIVLGKTVINGYINRRDMVVHMVYKNKRGVIEVAYGDSLTKLSLSKSDFRSNMLIEEHVVYDGEHEEEFIEWRAAALL